MRHINRFPNTLSLLASNIAKALIPETIGEYMCGISPERSASNVGSNQRLILKAILIPVIGAKGRELSIPKTTSSP
jgi:hypothetical protein